MKKKIISLISITAALALTITATLNLFPPLYEKYVNSSLPNEAPVDSVVISEENFPDENFRKYVLDLEASLEGEHTADGVFDKEELSQIVSVNVGSLEITDLKGVEYFTALESLDCSHNGLEALDICGLANISKLDCSFNKLSELNVKSNSLLSELCCSNNPIKELDLSGNYNLWRFECSNTQLTSLNVDIINPDEPDKQTEFDYFEVNDSSYIALNCNKEAFDFDLASLPGSFDVEKASNWIGAEPEGTVIKNITNGIVITYTYDVGRDLFVDFRITFAEGHSLARVEDRSGICCEAADLWQCSDCGLFFADEEGKAEAVINTKHTYDEGVVEKQPTCTEEGILIKTCQVCGYEHSEVMETLPHHTEEKYEFDENRHWKICADCGQEFECEDHTFEEGSNVCLVCGETIVKHIHQPEFVEEKAPSCTEEGLKEHYYCAGCDKYFADLEASKEISYEELIIEKLAHQYELKYDESQHWEECVLCGEKVNAEKHGFEEKRTEPTCCKEGNVKNICTVCGYGEPVETIPATGKHTFDENYTYDDAQHWHNCIGEDCTERNEAAEHSFTKIEITKNPTCAEEGIMTYTCESCGYSKTEAIPVNESHLFSEEYVQVDEHTHAKVCTLCGKYYDTFEHRFDDIEIVREASCQDGILRYHCICGYYKDEAVPAVGEHDFSGGYADLGEQHSAVCKVCGTTSEPQEHYYDIEIVGATCCEGGKMIYTCKHCSHSYTEDAGEPTGNHSFSAEFTLDGDKHIHKCTTEGCAAADIHEKDKCGYNPPPANPPVYDAEDRESDDNSELAEKPVIEIVWPTTMGVILNPYKMNVKISEDTENDKLNFTESSDGSSNTVISNELSFINNGNTEIKVTVTGSVSALTDADGKGHTKPSDKIVFADDNIEQPGWNAEGTVYSEGETRNAILLFLEVASGLDNDGKSGIYSKVFDKNNKNQMLLGPEKASRHLFNISPKTENGAGITKIKLFGDLAADPDISWYEVLQTDYVNISLVFDVSFDDPTENGNAIEDGEKSDGNENPAIETEEPVKTEEPPKKEDDRDGADASEDDLNNGKDKPDGDSDAHNDPTADIQAPVEAEPAENQEAPPVEGTIKNS